MAEPARPTAEELWEHAPGGLMLTGADGTILRANATLCHWLGFEAAELEGKRRVQDLYTVGGRVFHQTHIAPLLHMQGSVGEVKLDLRCADGRTLPALINAVRRTHDGAVYDELAVMMLADRHRYERELLHARRSAEAALDARLEAEAQLLKANEQLSAADRRKDEFLATLAHELRNPLAPMRNVLEVLRTPDLPAERSEWARALLDRQLSHLTTLVDDLLEVSRITQNKLELRPIVLELPSALQDALDATHPLMAGSGHRFEVDVPTVALAVRADPTRLTQIVFNLLSNAAKYTPPGGRVWLRVAAEGDAVVISVRDSGIGLPPQNLSSVFEMFSQVAPAMERSQGGLGIGLALVKGLVDLHGGSVAASSGGLGQGSEFTVRLPAVALAGSVAAAATEPEPAGAGAQRVLVVDDNADAAESLGLLLSLLGHEVQTAGDGHAALQLAERFAPQLVLLDIGLPGLNGYEVARAIRGAPWGQAMQLVAVTGWGQDRDRQAALEAGFDRHLTKPVQPEDLDSILGTSAQR